MFFICVRLLNCGIGCFIGEGVGLSVCSCKEERGTGREQL